MISKIKRKSETAVETGMSPGIFNITMRSHIENKNFKYVTFSAQVSHLNFYLWYNRKRDLCAIPAHAFKFIPKTILAFKRKIKTAV